MEPVPDLFGDGEVGFPVHGVEVDRGLDVLDTIPVGKNLLDVLHSHGAG